MIVFCEDCGQRNQLKSGLTQDGKAVFTCTECGYKNAYVLSSTPVKRIETLDQSLKQIIASIPDVLGSFILDRKTRDCINHMPGSLREEDLVQLGEPLHQTLDIGCHYFNDIQSLTLQIGEKQLFVVLNRFGYVLIIVTINRELTSAEQAQILETFTG